MARDGGEVEQRRPMSGDRTTAANIEAEDRYARSALPKTQNPAWQALLQAVGDNDEEAYYQAIQDGAFNTGVDDDIEQDPFPDDEDIYEAPDEL